MSVEDAVQDDEVERLASWWVERLVSRQRERGREIEGK